jgi:hypothetical protein
MAQGRSNFTRGELEEIRRLVREKQVADRDRQKSIRARLRAMGFRISDFADRPGFVESDLDELIARGAITVITDESGHTAAVPLPARRHADVKPRTYAPISVREGDGLARVARDAMRALAKKARLHEAETRVPARPGLYAIYGDAETWSELGLGDPPDERPLYVGKAEDSLVTRDLSTHFGNGRTGSSTVRRSFAALLREPLRLSGLPRNPTRPERFANYGLSREHDERLTDWMRTKLELAVWPKPVDCEFSLLQVELVLLGDLLPPLNLKDVTTPWTAQLKAARATMASQARTWAERAGDS